VCNCACCGIQPCGVCAILMHVAVVVSPQLCCRAGQRMRATLARVFNRRLSSTLQQLPATDARWKLRAPAAISCACRSCSFMLLLGAAYLGLQVTTSCKGGIGCRTHVLHVYRTCTVHVPYM
jgi:hypothetical protein